MVWCMRHFSCFLLQLQVAIANVEFIPDFQDLKKKLIDLQKELSEKGNLDGLQVSSAATQV